VLRRVLPARAMILMVCVARCRHQVVVADRFSLELRWSYLTILPPNAATVLKTEKIAGRNDLLARVGSVVMI